MVGNLFGLGKKSNVKSESKDTSYKGKIWTEKYQSVFASSNANGNTPIRLTYDSVDSENIEFAIRAIYKQVFGNVHLMESERLPQIDSQLRSGKITVKEFVRQLAKSSQYKALFWENYSNLQTIEYNFQHLLGRAPKDYSEISEHIRILAEDGFSAEIDSYLDSQEYKQNFGNNIVPYCKDYQLQTDKSIMGVSDSLPLLQAASNKIQPTAVNNISPSRLQPSVSRQAFNYVRPVGQVYKSDVLPSNMINSRELDLYVYAESSRRRPVSVDKKFIDMARNTRPHQKR